MLRPPLPAAWSHSERLWEVTCSKAGDGNRGLALILRPCHCSLLRCAGNYSPVLVTQLDAKKKGYSE